MKQKRRNMLPFTVTEFEKLTGLFAEMIFTSEKPVLIPGEAILGIEAIAAGVAAPGRTILNIVTGPYGRLFGTWLRRGGADVKELAVPFDEVVSIEAAAKAMDQYHPCAVALVHAEAITGGSNPTEEIMKLAHEKGMMTILDSVSAIGAEPVQMDAWGIDFVAVGPQKALAGPNGISAVGVSAEGWRFLEENKRAPRQSALSLLDRRLAADAGSAVPDNLPVLEARSCMEALELVKEEGLEHVNYRHRLASGSAIAGLRALGLIPWQKEERGYSPLNTTVRIPDNFSAAELQLSGILANGDGELKGRLLRMNHYGAYAEQEYIEQAVIVLAGLFNRKPEQALTAVRKIWGSENE